MTFSQSMRVLIVEDQPSIRSSVSTILKKRQFSVVGECGSVKEACDIIEKKSPDLLVLDVSLSDGSAFDIFSIIPHNNYKIVFLTAYEQHAIRAIKLGALDYLLKPIDEEEFDLALNRVLQSLPATNQQISIAGQQYADESSVQKEIVLRSHNSIEIIRLSDIEYCHSYAGYTTFFLVNGQRILTSRHLKEFIQILPTSFMRTHKSYLVNRQCIIKYINDGQALILNSGKEIPVSVRQKSTIRGYLNKLT